MNKIKQKGGEKDFVQYLGSIKEQTLNGSISSALLLALDSVVSQPVNYK